MKTKFAIFLVVVSLGVTSLRADDAVTKAANQSNREVALQRMAQIDLNAALKQYEKISNELADAKTELLVARETASTEQAKKDCDKMEAKVTALSRVCDYLGSVAEDRAIKMDDQAKVSGLAANQAVK